MLRRLALCSAALLLTACGQLDNNAWFVSRYKSSANYLFEPDAKPRQADPRPDVKSLVLGDMSAVFGRTTVRNVNVGPPRPNGYAWQSCLKANVVSITNQDAGLQYFVVEIDGGKIGLRRVATEADKCEFDVFEPIGPDGVGH
jgi:hypothetical protein